MKLGDLVLIQKECLEKGCDFVSDEGEECSKAATQRHSFLLEDSRHNPNSAGYRKDDISWCSDDEAFSCDEHKEIIRSNPPSDMYWCSTFTRSKGFEHMFLYWKETKLDMPEKIGDAIK